MSNSIALEQPRLTAAGSIQYFDSHGLAGAPTESVPGGHLDGATGGGGRFPVAAPESAGGPGH